MKVIYKGFGTYSEISQQNSIRWVILKKDGDNFVSQSSVLKCKDFFNDWVYTRKTGKPMSIYGFDTGKMTDVDPNKAGFLLVYNLTIQFKDNLHILNTWLEEQGTPGIFILEDYILEELPGDFKSMIIEIPPYFLENTYRISLLSLLIRLMNVDTQFTSWNEVVSFKYNTQDQSLFDRVIKLNLWFNYHPKVKNYIYYAGPEYNSKGTFQSIFIHNNGVVNWGTFLGEHHEM